MVVAVFGNCRAAVKIIVGITRRHQSNTHIVRNNIKLPAEYTNNAMIGFSTLSIIIGGGEIKKPKISARTICGNISQQRWYVCKRYMQMSAI
jgi:hypothetical protein